MADVDINPFGGAECPSSGEHESRPEEPMDEHIPLSLVAPGGRSTWEPEKRHIIRRPRRDPAGLCGPRRRVLKNKTHERLR